MKIIQVQLSCTTKKEFYKQLGILMVVQKLLNDYIVAKNQDESIGPEGFAEEWIKKMELEGVLKDQVLNYFTCALMAVSRSENGFTG